MNRPRSDLPLEAVQAGDCAGETFIIVQTTDLSIPVHHAYQDAGLDLLRLDGTASRSSAGGKTRRILVFDDDPDTLRIVFEHHAKEFAAYALRGRSTWKLRLLWILTMDLVVKVPLSLWRLIW
jgi:hypothetical protein